MMGTVLEKAKLHSLLLKEAETDHRALLQQGWKAHGNCRGPLWKTLGLEGVFLGWGGVC